MRFNGISGKNYILDRQIASGGEGSVWSVNGDDKVVAKIYHQEKLASDPELENKITYMYNNPPDDSILSQIAWPMDLLSENGKFAGFIMPKLDTDTNLKKIYPYPPNPSMPITTRHKLIIALNICIVISEVHKAGYIFGDFNPMNIGVNLKNGHVAFFDADSYHFTDPQTNHTYRCGVGADGYIAPELIEHIHNTGSDFLGAPLPTFTKETDYFALAIHIFKLLMNGFTPFNGIKECESVSQSSPATGNKAIERDNYCFKAGNKPQSLATPELSSLNPDIQYLFKKTFEGGVKDPKNRATADEWKKALEEYLGQLKICTNDPNHYFYINNSTCPYCEAYKRYTAYTSGLTSKFKTGTSGISQVSFSQPVNIPNSGNSYRQTQSALNTPSQSRAFIQQNSYKKPSKVKPILRVLCWVFFFPIMLLIKIWKSSMGVVAKLFLSYLVLPLLMVITIHFGQMINGNFPLNDDKSLSDTISPNAKGVVDGDFKYVKYNNSYIISVNPKSKTSISGNVVIPTKFKDKPVKAIAENGFEGCTNITSVEIPESITTIGKGAFAGCDELTDLTLPFIGHSEESTGPEAVFGYIFGFETENASKAPDEITEVEKYSDAAYTIDAEAPARMDYTWQCTTCNDGDGWFDPEVVYYYYQIPESIKHVTVTRQTSIRHFAFTNCSFIETIDYPDEINKESYIGVAAFRNCSALQFKDSLLEVKDNYISVGSYAFANCSAPTKIVVSNYVREIGAGAFMGCNNVTEISIPFLGGSQSAIGPDAVLGYIFGFEVEKENKTPENDTNVEQYTDTYFTINEQPPARVGYTWQCTTCCVFGGFLTPEIHYYYYGIPDSLEKVSITFSKSIPHFAFNNCSNIKTIVIGEGYSLGEYSMQNCPAEITVQ